ncbi:ribonuclease E/G [Rhodospirillum sp. A1_3_36]|uniref:ribonuclease E/G n=1 Tax=Rhodospirillum sp. A1_3_36 TaxID=3391666 RepID=UPI0039A5E9A1
MSREGTGAFRILVSDGPGETRWALLEDNTVIEVVHQWVHAPEVGSILAGRMGKRTPDGRAAFVTLGGDPDGFLPLSDISGPPPSVGSLVAVQVVQEAQGPKGPKLTAKITLPGRLLVYTPFAPGLGLSPKTGSSSQRSQLRARIEALMEPGEGAIARTAASAPGVRDNALAAELEAQRAKWLDIREGLSKATGPGLLLPAPSPLESWLDELGEGIAAIHCDTGSRAAALKPHLRLRHPAWAGSLSAEVSARPSPFEREGVEEALEEALSPRLPLPGGGWVIIEETQALTAIDIDSGATNPEAATRAALPMIARQIRLRALAGQILVDLPRRKTGGPNREAVDTLATLLAKDPASPQLLGVTRGGLVEIIRPRRRPPLSHLFLMPLAARETAPEARLLAALRHLVRTPTRSPSLTVTPAEERLLLGPLAQAFAQARDHLGLPITLIRS